MAFLDFLKGKKNKEKTKEVAAEAPVETPVEAPAEKQPGPISLGSITGGMIESELAHIINDDRTLFQVLDETSNRLIATASEPNVSVGLRLQDLRCELTSEEMPFFDFDTALIAAVEQMENYCKHRPDKVEAALARLAPVFEARKNPAPGTKKDVLRLKGHYLNAQLVTVQGQLYNSLATIAEYRRLLTQYESNKALDPLGQRAAFIRQQLEHTEKMQQVLTDNIGTLQTSIATNEVEISNAPLVAIDPKAPLESTIEMINEQREAYKAFLRQRSDFQKLLEQINTGAMELTALEIATEMEVRASVQRIEADRIMREKRAARQTAYNAYDATQKYSPAAATPTVNAAQASVEMAEKVEKAEEIEPAPQMFDFL